MDANDKINQVDLSSLRIIHYGDPRLAETATEIAQVDAAVGALVERMFELMFSAAGVGLAAPQVGVTVRLFVASSTFSPDDRRVYINPRILSVGGSQDNDEGCLSLPGIHCTVKRPEIVVIEATGLDGERFTETGDALTARVFHHEMDHLNGTMIADRMGSVARLANRRALKELRQRFEAEGS